MLITAAILGTAGIYFGGTVSLCFLKGRLNLRGDDKMNNLILFWPLIIIFSPLLLAIYFIIRADTVLDWATEKGRVSRMKAIDRCRSIR